MIEDSDVCPGCGEQLAYWHMENKTFYTRKISVEVSGVYDGGLYNLCPECNHAWHRWVKGDRLYAIAEGYIQRHNARRAGEPSDLTNWENEGGRALED